MIYYLQQNQWVQQQQHQQEQQLILFSCKIFVKIDTFVQYVYPLTSEKDL